MSNTNRRPQQTVTSRLSSLTTILVPEFVYDVNLLERTFRGYFGTCTHGYTGAMPESATFRAPCRRPGRESLERILTAAEEQLRDEELEFFTVDRVLERAGVSVGSFYRRFPAGKNALLQTIQDRLHARTQPAILEALKALEHEEQSLEEAVDQAFSALINNVLRERRLSRAFVMFSAFDPVIRRRSQQIHRERRDALRAVFGAHADEIVHPDLEVATDLVYAMYSSTMNGRLVFFAPGPVLRTPVGDDAIFAQLKASITGFLRGNGSGEPDRD